MSDTDTAPDTDPEYYTQMSAALIKGYDTAKECTEHWSRIAAQLTEIRAAGTPRAQLPDGREEWWETRVPALPFDTEDLDADLNALSNLITKAYTIAAIYEQQMEHLDSEHQIAMRETQAAEIDAPAPADVPASEVDTATVRMLAKAWSNDLDNSSDLVVSVTNWVTFRDMMLAIGDYNRFDPIQVAGTFGPLFDRAKLVRFGREGSPVMYVHLPVSTTERYGFTDGDPVYLYSPEVRRDYAAEVFAWAGEMRASEIGARQLDTGKSVARSIGTLPDMVRIWWD